MTVAVGVVLLAGAVFWVGALLGERRGASQAVRSLNAWLVPDSVHEYQALEAGDIEAAKSICGQRIWAIAEQQGREFSRSEMPAMYQRAMPEARRIILVVSNADLQSLLYNATNWRGGPTEGHPSSPQTNRSTTFGPRGLP